MAKASIHTDHYSHVPWEVWFWFLKRSSPKFKTLKGMGGVAKLGKEPSCELWWGVFLLNIPPPGKVGWIYDIWKLLAAASTHLPPSPLLFFHSFRPSPTPFCQLSRLFPSFLSSSIFVTNFSALYSPFLLLFLTLLISSLLLCSFSPSLLSYSVLRQNVASHNVYVT